MGKNFRGNRGGGRGRGGHNKGRGGGGRGGGRAANREWGSRSEIQRTNARFEKYYNELEIVPEEGGEREKFWEALRSELPNSFRFAGSKGNALSVQKRLVERYIPEITSVKWEGEYVTPPEPVSWYPDQLAWSMTTPKKIIRKFPPFASFQKFLVSENSVGNITRQEIVSMIPPLLLNVKPGMTVLDLCAAPGSKSTQLLEMVHGGEEARVRKILEDVAAEIGRELTPEGALADAEKSQAAGEDDWSDDGRSTGLLIANDVDYRRAQMLIHQCKRLNSPNLIVTNHDAILFPSIKLPSESGKRYLKFDRILADVPCTGDGTTRKNPEIWKDWSPAKGLGLHLTQVKILLRALQMLKVGGQIVYSTCSMNPIENEAVVASAINRCGGTTKVKILDRSDALPGLQRRPGLLDWKVLDKTGRWWTNWDEVTQHKQEQGEEGTSRLTLGMFPPAADEAIPLQNCIRIYPHLQDTGGFFIAVLEKQSEIRTKPDVEPVKTSATAPLVTMIVEAIESQTKEETNMLAKIDGLDTLAPSTNLEDVELHEGNVAPVVRQNQENNESDSKGESPSRKRSLEDEALHRADALATTKRLKTREEAEAPAYLVDEERKVHYPPPPAAMLDETAHHQENAEKELALRKSNAPHEEPFIYLPADHPELLDIYQYYSLSPRFPRGRFLVRNATGEPAKAIYYSSDLARQILQENEGKGLKFVHCGVKMFVKQDVNHTPDACKWRIQSEGLPIIESWVGEQRVVRLTKRSTLRKLLIEMFPRIANDAHLDFPDIGERVIGMTVGCCVLRVEPTMSDDGFEERMVMPLWKGQSSLNLMLPKEERQAALLRLFNETSELVNHSQGYKMKNLKESQLQASTPDLNNGAPAADNGSNGAQDMNGGPGNSSSSENEDDDGGVLLSGAGPSAENGTSLLAPPRLDELAQAAEGERQNVKDQTREVAPGVTDEDESFNKTV